MARLLIVSNRLPLTLSEKSGKVTVQGSSGGLVSALGSFLDGRRREKDFECVWVGWPGIHLQGPGRDDSADLMSREYSAHPVWMASEETDLFYNGFCNRTLWPLFHYLPSYARYDEDSWDAYKRVNRLFRDSILGILEPGDTVWIQDYQLLLLPRLLREASRGTAIGFFLHIPFPSFEVFRLLPTDWRVEILEGMLGADSLGFHTRDYTQYFLRSVHRTLGFEHHLGTLFLGDHVARVGAFPLGIDYAKFRQAALEPAALKEKAALASRFGGMRIISSVDRLDYTKGILHRLMGFEHFLIANPEWLGKVVLVLTVVPSREEVDQYRRMKEEIDGWVGRINGEFGTPHWMPVLYQYRSLAFPDLVALYGASDVALITPLRDGMNLVAKEFLACKEGDTGVLILSEMAGAAGELAEALIINPNHKGEIARAIHRALVMPAEEKIRRCRAMQERLRKHDAYHWADGFLRSLDEVREIQGRLDARLLGEGPRRSLLAEYRQAASRLLLLDYDGTLIPFSDHPQRALPDPGLLALLKRLGEDGGNRLFIISGRPKEVLEKWFGSLGLGLIAEHGAWISERGQDWRQAKPLEVDWKPELQPILEAYVDRLPGSFIEDKEFSVAWHYRNADPEPGSQCAKELIDTLVQQTANLDVQVLEGKMVIELRCSGVNKGTAAVACKGLLRPSFTLAVGDDSTDEDMFRALAREARTIRVGMQSSYAQYNLPDYLEVRRLLEEISGAEAP